jgi:hypothetical protein
MLVLNDFWCLLNLIFENKNEIKSFRYEEVAEYKM